MQAPSNAFLIENGKGTITIEGNKLICKSENRSYDTEVNIDELQYAYICKRHDWNGDTDITLFVFDHAQQWLPVNYKGFRSAYEFLSNRYGFNNELFFQQLNNVGGPAKTEIWRKEHQTNFQILDDVDFSDIRDGFKLDGDPGFVGWDSSPRWTIKKPQVETYVDQYETTRYRFKVPARVGCIVLSDLEFTISEDQPDMPIMRYYAHCHLRGKRQETYFMLKEALIRMFGRTNNFYERDDQNNYTVEGSNIEFSITYNYDSEHTEESGYTWLNIFNQREYPGFRRNAAYEASISIDAHALLNGRIGISQNYKTNPAVLDRPEVIKEKFGNQDVLWRDDVNRHIGFGIGGTIITINMDDVIAFHLWNNLPARFSGASYLYVSLKNGEKPEILNAYASGEMDYLMPLLKEISGLEVVKDQDGMDC